jgi:hypothetical protein
MTDLRLFDLNLLIAFDALMAISMVRHTRIRRSAGSGTSFEWPVDQERKDQ